MSDEAIVGKLADAAKQGFDERIFVRGDKKVDYGRVAQVMSIVTSAGYKRVALVTEPDAALAAAGQGADERGVEAEIHTAPNRASGSPASRTSALLAAAVFALVGGTRFPEAQEGIPVEVITDNQFSQITKGETSAKEVAGDAEAPRRPGRREDRANAIRARTSATLPAPPKRPAEMKVAETRRSRSPPPPPPREPAGRASPMRSQEEAAKAAEKAKAEAEAQAEARRREGRGGGGRSARRPPKAKAKAEAEAKRAAEAKADRGGQGQGGRRSEARRRSEGEGRGRGEGAQGGAKLAKKLDLGDLRQFLNTKDKNQSTGATGAEVQKTASLGTATGTAQRSSTRACATPLPES